VGRGSRVAAAWLRWLRVGSIAEIGS
jgi:hypothetical protein